MTALLAGLRKGDLKRLTWADVDFERRSLRIRGGKGRAEDHVPMRSELAQVLRARLEKQEAVPADRVFPQVVTDLTRQKDFLRAGLARKTAVLDTKGLPVMTGKGPKARPKMRIVTEDEQGRVIDLHSLRTTFATKLVRESVAPLLTKQLMRHASFETTEAHYVDLSHGEARAALDSVPFSLGQPLGKCQSECQSSTGTTVHPGASEERESGARSGGGDAAHRILEGLRAASRALRSGSRVERPKGLEPSTFSLGS